MDNQGKLESEVMVGDLEMLKTWKETWSWVLHAITLIYENFPACWLLCLPFGLGRVN